MPTATLLQLQSSNVSSMTTKLTSLSHYCPPPPPPPPPSAQQQARAAAGGQLGATASQVGVGGKQQECDSGRGDSSPDVGSHLESAFDAGSCFVSKLPILCCFFTISLLTFRPPLRRCYAVTVKRLLASVLSSHGNLVYSHLIGFTQNCSRACRRRRRCWLRVLPV